MPGQEIPDVSMPANCSGPHARPIAQHPVVCDGSASLVFSAIAVVNRRFGRRLNRGFGRGFNRGFGRITICGDGVGGEAVDRLAVRVLVLLRFLLVDLTSG